MEGKDRYKLYYTIGEVAQELGVELGTLRFWEKHFPQYAPKRTASGRRRYTHDQLAGFRQVYHLLRVEGVSIEHAKTRLKHMGSDEENRIKALSHLLRMRQLLVELKDLL